MTVFFLSVCVWGGGAACLCLWNKTICFISDSVFSFLFLIKIYYRTCYIIFDFYFQEYVLRVDPVTNLGLSAESVYSYHIGEIVKTKGQ